VIGLLAALTIPVAEVAVQRTREQELRLALREIRTAIDAHKKAYDEGRIARKIDSTGYPETLTALVEGVDDAKDLKKRKIYFLRSIPPDPMSSEPATDPGETWATRSYESPPNEPRPGKDVYDVHSRSPRIGLNGVQYSKW